VKRSIQEILAGGVAADAAFHKITPLVAEISAAGNAKVSNCFFASEFLMAVLEISKAGLYFMISKDG